MTENNNDPSKKFDIDMSPFRDFISHMDTFFNQSFRQMNDVFHFRPFQLQTRETHDSFIIESELPGYNRNQIAIEIFGNQLRITVDNVNKIFNNNGDFLKKSQQKMERTVTLPFDIPEDETTASFKNGLLKIVIPKQNANRRFIDIDV
ncbi:Hsp20/alpha crystallin family protein [Virgibacillus halophilus]|uniref:Hsp20/alpha crystallin family protein n=1 Tax=Tigheibacillus halophilus TaxID=361280 RepID=A0ABU5CAW8_9BACI|nr:Hsp20/alpha crystallin family protein [Virgibacillus halophilus]